MQARNVKVALRDGEMGAYLALPDRMPVGAIIAIMEIWGVNDAMRHHAHEFAQAGFLCLVPDLFWRQEPGVELSDADPRHVQKAFDLYYDFDYDLAVRDMEDTRAFLQQHMACNGKVGAVGYCLGGKLCYLMCCRTDIDCTSSTTFAKLRTCIGRLSCTWRCATAGCRQRSMTCWNGACRSIRWSPFTNTPARITLSRGSAARPTASQRPTARSR